MAQITETIGLRSFEVVRDQIGAILADELPSQATLNGDTRLNAEVFVERFRPVSDQETELKSIIVIELSQGDYDMKPVTSQDGTYTFNIDCYEFGKTTATERGDKTASVKLQRLLGVVQGILSHPKYKTLGITPPFIEHTEVSGFKISDPTGKKDAASMVLGRIEFKVRVPDKLNGSLPVPIDGYTTQALLGLTDLGYTYGTQNLPPVPPVCADVEIKLNGIFIVNAESGALIDIPVKDTYGAVVGSWNGSEFIVPANIPDDYDITINGSTFETINSNTDIIVKDTAGAQVGSKIGSEWIVPEGVDAVRLYQRPDYSGAVDAGILGAVGDVFWRKDNNIGDLSTPEIGIQMRLKYGSKHLLESTNVFGNLFSLTGTTGGYYDPSDLKYYDKFAVETTRALAFPDELGVDHLISYLIQTKQVGLMNWYDWNAYGLTLTIGAFTGFYLPSTVEMIHFGNWGISLGYTNNVPFDWGSGLKLTGDHYNLNMSTAMVVQSYNHMTSTPKTNNNKAVLLKPIDINLIFG